MEISGNILRPLHWSGSPILIAAILLAGVLRAFFAIEEADSGWQGVVPAASSQSGDRGGTQSSGGGLRFAPSLDASALGPGQRKTVPFETVGEGFDRPRGIAAANGRLYVADPGRKALLVLDGDGVLLAEVLGSDRRFVEPVDVAAGYAQEVYVLDAGGGGRVTVHDRAGAFLRAVPIAKGVLDRSRGIHVDRQGRIWAALTPSLAVAAFNADGLELLRFSTDLGGAELQPVDVAYFADDAIYVSAVGVNAVVRFTLLGEPRMLWRLVAANSLDGPHLSLDREGTLYVTQPEQSGGILRITGDAAEELEAWILPGGNGVRKLVGISVEEGGSPVVTDSENGRIYRAPVAAGVDEDG